MNAIVQTERHFPAGSGLGRELQPGRSAAQGLRPLLYLVLSLVPSATLMCGWVRFHDAAPWSGVPTEGAIAMAVALWFAELTLVPLLVRFSQALGAAPGPSSAHYDFQFLQAFAPPVLMLTPLALVVSSLFAWGVAAAFVAVGMLLFFGRYADCDADKAFAGLSWLVVELAFVGWAATALLLTVV